MKTGSRPKTWKKRLVMIILSGGLVLIWALVSHFQWIRSSLLPSPGAVLLALIQLLLKGYNGISFWHHLFASLSRLFWALLLAVGLAVSMGLLSGMHAWLDVLFDPLVQFTRPLPPLAYYVLLIMWLGIGEGSKVVLLGMAAFPPIYLSAYQAVQQVPINYLRVARSLGASRMQMLKHVVLPAGLPQIMTGIRTAVGVCYTTLISAEMVAATSGIGWIVIDSYNYLKTDVVFAMILIMGITGMLMDDLLRRLTARLVFWTGR